MDIHTFADGVVDAVLGRLHRRHIVNPALYRDFSIFTLVASRRASKYTDLSVFDNKYGQILKIRKVLDNSVITLYMELIVKYRDYMQNTVRDILKYKQPRWRH